MQEAIAGISCEPAPVEDGIMIMKGNQMFEFHKKKNPTILTILTIIISACSPAIQGQADISTAVAQTVAAQNSLTEIASRPTPTPVPAIETTVLPDVVGTNTPVPLLGPPGC